MEDQSGQAESPAVEENKTKGEEVPQGHKDNQKENGDASKEDVVMDDSEAKDPKTLGGEDTSKVQKEDGNSETEKKESVKPPRSIEKEVGITQYVGTHEGFFGILKQRYSDFQVNEVSSSGEVIHLTDLSIPPVPQDIPEVPTEMPPELTPVKMAEIDRILGKPLRLVACPPPKAEEEEDAASNEKEEEKKDDMEVRICVDNTDKEGRTAIHKTVKAKYPNVDSLFREDNGKKFIVIRKKKAKGMCRQVRTSWPRSKQHTTFVLYKENIDTIVAINLVAYKLRLKPNLFAYAGTKDKRAKTSQLVSVSKVAPEKLAYAARKERGVYIGNFTFHHKPMKLGSLQGNHFRIVLREVKASDEAIEAAVASLRSQGFINYYGTQRFGTSNVPTHSIGKELLRSQWQEAVNLILSPRENDDTDVSRGCRVWAQKKDPEAALRAMRRAADSSIEGQLLHGLNKLQKNDLVGAIMRIPRNIRNLYLHAYQSYLWNRVASRRVEEFGLKVLPGDLVRKQGTAVTDEEAEEVMCEDLSTEVEADMEEAKTVEGGASTTESGAASTEGGSPSVRVLSAEEAKETDITEVLLPLPGYNIVYPENVMKEWYSALLEEDGLSFSALKHHVKMFSVGGVYRRLIMKPSNVESSTCFYDDPTLPLIQSDMDKLRDTEVQENILTEGANKAVLLEMTLPPSSYATMALRELLKMDTSSEMQASLNSESSKQWQRAAATSREENGSDDDDGNDDEDEKRDEPERWRRGRNMERERRGWGRDRRGGKHFHRGNRGWRQGWSRERGDHRGDKRPSSWNHDHGGRREDSKRGRF
ncbi:pseudouridylate synthase 7 homolog isoform X2 [Penaeus japonicus]|uniref:pseudouridylate synthase 7 homolog isoform X2 n=1 Tax=Penaeus japonicus TaxID=27405 RepID=UPI001C70F444|nr:pseudouridylate synthase 7 homolog isoform X2 [Penaeus japonicus]